MRDDGPRAWIELPSEGEVAATRPADHPYNFGFVPAMARLIAAHGEIGPLFARLFSRIMFGSSRLDRREREMIAAVAAAAQDCHY
jgi:alkylhydroperoxidase/carboxymuconolactone decarboxylase family protein YurZ